MSSTTECCNYTKPLVQLEIPMQPLHLSQVKEPKHGPKVPLKDYLRQEKTARPFSASSILKGIERLFEFDNPAFFIVSCPL